MSTFEKEIAELLHKAMEALIVLESRIKNLEKVAKVEKPPFVYKGKNRISCKISRNPQAMELTVKMFHKGATYKEIAETINREIPGINVSTAAVGRFCLRYRKAGGE